MVKTAIVLTSLLVLCAGCASIDYIGDSLEPTSHVDVYFSEEDIEYEYRVIGHVTAHVSGDATVYSGEDLMRKIKDRVMKNGGDAIIVTGHGWVITGTSTEHTSETTETDDGVKTEEEGQETVNKVREVTAIVIRYKRETSGE